MSEKGNTTFQQPRRNEHEETRDKTQNKTKREGKNGNTSHSRARRCWDAQLPSQKKKQLQTAININKCDHIQHPRHAHCCKKNFFSSCRTAQLRLKSLLRRR
eukprot:GDKJ01018661.1.p1 GENE.GDKJ01018661.1~~GDKJ01018661.1.p1  ORF type:complete len:102 (+),score=16.23 GDKJ01018661.1:169-474(+)